MRVAVSGDNFKNTVVQLENGNVESAATKVVNRDNAVLLLVEAVGERRGGGLVDDAEHVQAGDLAGVLGRVPLAVVEVGRHGDDRVGHLFAEMILGGARR